MSYIIDRYAFEMDSFKLSEFVVREKAYIIKVEYEIEITWKNVKQYWVSLCRRYAIDNQKQVLLTITFNMDLKPIFFEQFTNDKNIIDWDSLADEILTVKFDRQKKDMLNEAKQTQYNIQASASREVIAEVRFKKLKEHNC